MIISRWSISQSWFLSDKTGTCIIMVFQPQSNCHDPMLHPEHLCFPLDGVHDIIEILSGQVLQEVGTAPSCTAYSHNTWQRQFNLHPVKCTNIFCISFVALKSGHSICSVVLFKNWMERISTTSTKSQGKCFSPQWEAEYHNDECYLPTIRG